MDLQGQGFDYLIVTLFKPYSTRDFTEYSPFSRAIREFDQEKLLLPKFSDYFPRHDALEWHRDRVFKS